MKKGNIYTPRDNKLRLEIILLYHDKSIADHGWQWKAVKLVARSYKESENIEKNVYNASK